MKVASGKVTGKAGRVIDGSAMLVAPVMMFVIETVALGRVTTGAEVEVGETRVRGPVAVAITTSGSCTAVAGASVMVAAGITTLTPKVEIVKAGAVKVKAGAVKVTKGAVRVPVVVANRLGTARVCAGAEIVAPDSPVKVKPPRVKVGSGRVTAKPGRVMEGKPRLVDPVTISVTEIVTPGRVTTGVLSGLVTLVGADTVGAAVAVAMTTSGSRTAVTGFRTVVIAGAVKLTPPITKPRAGADKVSAGAVIVARGAVNVAPTDPDAVKAGAAMVCAGAVTTCAVLAVIARPPTVIVAKGNVRVTAGRVMDGSGMVVRPARTSVIDKVAPGMVTIGNAAGVVAPVVDAPVVTGGNVIAGNVIGGRLNGAVIAEETVVV